MATIISNSPEETLVIGEAWATEAQTGWVIGLDGDLGAGHDEHQEDQKKESKHVVELILPDGCHDEDELDENGAERQDPCQHDRDHRVQEPRLHRDLPC